MSMRCNLSAEPVIFDYDSVGNLIRGEYGMFDRIFRTPDLVGNIYRDENRKDRTYDRGGRLLSDGEFHYSYDCEGNLVCKSRRNLTEAPKAQAKHRFLGIFSGSEKAKADNTKAWQTGDTCYTWLANGMLESVITPEGKAVTFEYDALGRRTAKTSDGTARMFCWDGNVLLHEWDCRENERPRLVTDDMGREGYDHEVAFENVITWVYDGQSFTPVAKVTEQERYTIVHDYLGTPTQAYDSKGKLVWEMLLDVYGNAKEYAGEKCFIPFRYQGQYEDNETCLYYNRFRFYDPKQGNYISQDPIKLAGNNPTLYGYVSNINILFDIFGLNITYYPLDNLGRPTGAEAIINIQSLGTGTDAVIDPPGWQGGEHPYHQQRGHLIAKHHGGSGNDPRNIVTITDGTNHPGMTKLENKITRHVKNGNTVSIKVTPNYNGNNLIPDSITIKAIDQNNKIIVDDTVVNGLRQKTSCCT